MIPLQMLLAALFGWLECEQREVIAFLREENRALKAQLGRRRLRLNGTFWRRPYWNQIASVRSHG